MKSACGLVVLEALQNGAVDDNLVVLRLPADHTKRLIRSVVIDVDLCNSRSRPGRNPFLVLVVVNHDGGASDGDGMFTHGFSSLYGFVLLQVVHYTAIANTKFNDSFFSLFSEQNKF